MAEDIDARDRAGRTALMYAVVEGELEKAKELIRSGADVNATDKHDWTALHFATQNYSIEFVKLLLESGAIVEAEDSNGNTPLSNAVFQCRDRDGEVIQILLQAGANKHHKNKYGVSPTDLATTIANYDVAQYLK